MDGVRVDETENILISQFCLELIVLLILAFDRWKFDTISKCWRLNFLLDFEVVLLWINVKNCLVNPLAVVKESWKFDCVFVKFFEVSHRLTTQFGHFFTSSIFLVKQGVLKLKISLSYGNRLCKSFVKWSCKLNYDLMR
jgi:hypothetical protein